MFSREFKRWGRTGLSGGDNEYYSVFVVAGGGGDDGRGRERVRLQANLRCVWQMGKDTLPMISNCF